jgi:hypothetical protein
VSAFIYDCAKCCEPGYYCRMCRFTIAASLWELIPASTCIFMHCVVRMLQPPAKWSKKFPLCKTGKAQSPVALSATKTVACQAQQTFIFYDGDCTLANIAVTPNKAVWGELKFDAKCKTPPYVQVSTHTLQAFMHARASSCSFRCKPLPNLLQTPARITISLHVYYSEPGQPAVGPA